MKRIIIIALVILALLFITGVVHGAGDIRTDTSPAEAQERPLTIETYQNANKVIVTTMSGAQLQPAAGKLQNR